MTDHDDILEQIEAYRPPEQLHPIATLTYELYDRAGFKFTEKELAQIRAELQKYYGDLKPLTDAVCGLSAFIMLAMQDLDDRVAARQIAELIRDLQPQYEPIGHRLVHVLQDIAKKTTGTLARFSGRRLEAEVRAPAFGATAPNGTVPLRALKPVAQPPPPRSRGPKRS
jgi:hypothetical protein